MEYHNENFDGEYDFRSRYHNGWRMGVHLHEYSELLYCKSGTVKVTVNGEAMTYSSGQLVWIPPNYVHQYECDGAEVVCAVFSNDLIPLFFKALDGRSICVSPITLGELSPIIDDLLRYKKKDYLAISGCLNLICAKVIEQSRFESGRNTDGILYQKVISYVAEHYTENITLSMLAKTFGYNEKYISHALHDLTGMNFRRILSFYRVNHAKRLLEKGSVSIATVATDSGFSALNTFHRAFKEVTGLTPTEYKRKFLRKKSENHII